MTGRRGVEVHRSECPMLDVVSYWIGDSKAYETGECDCTGPADFARLLEAVKDEIKTGQVRGALVEAAKPFMKEES